MSDYCTNCSKVMFGDKVETEIDVYKIFNDLDEGYEQSCLCEGCGLRYITKLNVKMLVTFYSPDKEIYETDNYEEGWKKCSFLAKTTTFFYPDDDV